MYVVALFGGAALVDGGQGQATGQTAGSGARIHPGQLESHQGQRQVLGPFDQPTLLGIEENSVMPDASKCSRRALLGGGPGVGVAGAFGDQARHGTARHRAGGLHQHLEIVAIGETPLDLPDIVAGQCAQCVEFSFGYSGHGDAPLSEIRSLAPGV
jgi:hypothetical protein